MSLALGTSTPIRSLARYGTIAIEWIPQSQRWTSSSQCPPTGLRSRPMTSGGIGGADPAAKEQPDAMMWQVGQVGFAAELGVFSGAEWR
jgi:hypothetical protein